MKTKEVWDMKVVEEDVEEEYFGGCGRRKFFFFSFINYFCKLLRKRYSHSVL